MTPLFFFDFESENALSGAEAARLNAAEIMRRQLQTDAGAASLKSAYSAEGKADGDHAGADQAGSCVTTIKADD